MAQCIAEQSASGCDKFVGDGLSVRACDQCRMFVSECDTARVGFGTVLCIFAEAWSGVHCRRRYERCETRNMLKSIAHYELDRQTAREVQVQTRQSEKWETFGRIIIETCRKEYTTLISPESTYIITQWVIQLGQISS